MRGRMTMMKQELAKLQALVQDLATQSRIAEYACSCAVKSGDWARAELEANRADSLLLKRQRSI